ncbi:MAG: glycosyltransferase family 2 protein [Ferruginibacter sp.]
MRHTGISVVIPNYNGVNLLPDVLPCLYAALKQTGLPYEVIISDDASTDESVHYIESYHPSVVLLKNKTNRGFGPTINEGIRIARYDWVLLLNSDVKLEPDYFTYVLPHFDDPDCFGVMGRIIGWDNEKIQDGGKYPLSHGVKIKTSENYIPLDPDKAGVLFSFYLSGANALLDRDKIRALNGFDDCFAPFYVEDVDLSLRAWRVGWTCHYEHRAVCRHQTSATIRSNNQKNKVRRIYYRNKCLLHFLHLTGWRKSVWYIQLLGEALIKLLTGQWYYLSAISDFMQHKQACRNSIENLRQLAEKTGHLYSYPEVVQRIKQHLSGKAINRF